MVCAHMQQHLNICNSHSTRTVQRDRAKKRKEVREIAILAYSCLCIWYSEMNKHAIFVLAGCWWVATKEDEEVSNTLWWKTNGNGCEQVWMWVVPGNHVVAHEEKCGHHQTHHCYFKYQAVQLLHAHPKSCRAGSAALKGVAPFKNEDNQPSKSTVNRYLAFLQICALKNWRCSSVCRKNCCKKNCYGEVTKNCY